MWLGYKGFLSREKKKKAHVVGIYIGQSVLQEVFHKKSILAVTQELCQVTG